MSILYIESEVFPEERRAGPHQDHSLTQLQLLQYINLTKGGKLSSLLKNFCRVDESFKVWKAEAGTDDLALFKDLSSWLKKIIEVFVSLPQKIAFLENVENKDNSIYLYFSIPIFAPEVLLSSIALNLPKFCNYHQSWFCGCESSSSYCNAEYIDNNSIYLKSKNERLNSLIFKTFERDLDLINEIRNKTLDATAPLSHSFKILDNTLIDNNVYSLKSQLTNIWFTLRITQKNNKEKSSLAHYLASVLYLDSLKTVASPSFNPHKYDININAPLMRFPSLKLGTVKFWPNLEIAAEISQQLKNYNTHLEIIEMNYKDYMANQDSDLDLILFLNSSTLESELGAFLEFYGRGASLDTEIEKQLMSDAIFNPCITSLANAALDDGLVYLGRFIANWFQKTDKLRVNRLGHFEVLGS